MKEELKNEGPSPESEDCNGWTGPLSGPFGAAVTLSILIDAFKPRLGATAASLDAALQCYS